MTKNSTGLIFHDLDYTPPSASTSSDFSSDAHWLEGSWDYGWNKPAPLPTPEEHAAYLAAQDARIAQAKKDRKHRVKHVDLPEDDAWTDDAMLYIKWPLGAFLEPEGYAAIQRMTKPNTTSYVRHMPRTRALARTIHQALPELSVWGKQTKGNEAAWATITAGKWMEGKNGRYQQRAMSEWDVLKMLTDPEARAIANSDSAGDIYSRIGQVRVDIDMDDTFNRWWKDAQALREIVGEITLVRDVFGHFGLDAQVYRTGNRGIQAVAPIPWMDRAAAWILTEAIRTVLKGTDRRTWWSKDFQSNLDALMRLPFGLHKWSGSLGLFLGRDGRILPVEEQIGAFVDAFVCRPDDYDRSWAEEMRPNLLPVHMVPKVTLVQIVAEFPRNPLVIQFLMACKEFGVGGWDEYVTHTKGVSLEEVIGQTQCSVMEAPLPLPCESVTHTKGGEENNGSEPSSALKSSTLGVSPAKLKQIGWGILNAGFQPGASFAYYVNVMKGVKGKNAIGWALVVHDGDREAAKAWLDEQAEQIEGSKADIAQRKALIAWGVENNDTYERFQRRRITAKHRELCGEVAEADTAAAARIVSALPALRLESNAKRKTFRADALVVIGHVVELMIAAARESEDGLIRVSDRTLAVEISRRWPRDQTNAMTVSRQMSWITLHPDIDRDKQNCLLEALKIVERPRKVTEPTVYALGTGG